MLKSANFLSGFGKIPIALTCFFFALYDIFSPVPFSSINGGDMSDILSGKVLFDYARAARTGLPEAVFCQGKPISVLLDLLAHFADGEPPVLFTRLDEAVFSQAPAAIAARYDYDPISRTAFSAKMPMRDGSGAAIVSAGSADAPVAMEAARTLEYLGIPATLFEDCGIAGLWRLVDKLPQINTHKAIIAVAGMEGALPSILGGLSPLPIFAAPSSVGYGVSAQGKTALRAMLASCASGIAVLNIDNGYGAACAAARVINLK